MTLRFVMYAYKIRTKLIVSYDTIHQYVWDNDHRLTIHVNFMIKCVCCYMGLGSNGCFVTSR
jgi:hypothetical protein